LLRSFVTETKLTQKIGTRKVGLLCVEVVVNGVVNFMEEISRQLSLQSVDGFCWVLSVRIVSKRRRERLQKLTSQLVKKCVYSWGDRKSDFSRD
jgi:hypothetical protein